MRTRQGQECVDLVQKGPHLRVAESRPDDNVTQRMANKTVEIKQTAVKGVEQNKYGTFCQQQIALFTK